MRLAHVIEKAEEPPADEMNDALEALNIMLRSWSARSLVVRALTQIVIPLTAGKYQYTIGLSGADKTSAKPLKITGGFVRDSNNIDTGLDVITREIYDSYQDKVISVARPVALYYDPGLAQQSAQKGTVNLYYIPDAITAYTMYLDGLVELNDVNLADVSTFEKPYERAIKYELAMELWPEYHKGNPPEIVARTASEAMHIVESMNAVQIVAAVDLPGTKGTSYNIYTGGYND